MSVRSLRLLQFAAAGGLALGILAGSAHAQSSGSWAMKAPLPAALDEVAVVYAAGKVHVLGGSVLGYTGP